MFSSSGFQQYYPSYPYSEEDNTSISSGFSSYPQSPAASFSEIMDNSHFSASSSHSSPNLDANHPDTAYVLDSAFTPPNPQSQRESALGASFDGNAFVAYPPLNASSLSGMGNRMELPIDHPYYPPRHQPYYYLESHCSTAILPTSFTGYSSGVYFDDQHQPGLDLEELIDVSLLTQRDPVIPKQPQTTAGRLALDRIGAQDAQITSSGMYQSSQVSFLTPHKYINLSCLFIGGVFCRIER
jgi:hypothetical protein